MSFEYFRFIINCFRDLGKQQVTRTGRRVAESKALSTSFVDPFLSK